ncbi:cytochrome b5-related protein-like isoform X2 [Artemia franciscana]|uniref:Cytochrome b5 heme-binding domain-containing protein n=2 Tax=Artemia franciscana TaxID=6661 RepID=A0AA88I8E2_ARTSF|nr:hypothetical protein QYM36_002689 [Artemia franciscana]
MCQIIEKEDDHGGDFPSSLPGFQTYPSGRDGILRTATHWINGKRHDDNIGDFWRVHDKLYDLTNFVQRHPGGAYWLEVTRGTDVTEAFESHHLTDNAEMILKKYFVREIEEPRNSPYTFKSDGFYKVLKRRVAKELPTIPYQGRTVKWHNVLLWSFFASFFLSGLYSSTLMIVLAGAILALLTNCSHNFYHKSNNWRMYAWDLSGLSSAEWRVSHAVSHHGFANTIYDYELSSFEPIFDFKPKGKNKVNRFVVPIFSWFLFLGLNHKTLIERMVVIATGKQKLRPENLLPFVELALLMFLSDDGWRLWNILMCSSSFWFGFVGLIAAHHHPDIFHEGDAPRYSLDWGLCQLDAVRDRWDVNSSDFLIATMYGEHTLHHLFPTIDHDKLPFLNHILVDTAKEFGIKEIEANRKYDFLKLWIGMYAQLIRNTPRTLKGQ